MKILYLAGDPGIDLGVQSGGAIHIGALVRALSDLGHLVVVVASSVSDTEDLAGRLGAFVRPARLAPWNRALVRLLRALNRLAGKTGREHPDLVRLLHNWTFGRHAAAVAREFSPDVIYERYSLWGCAGALLARRTETPLVLEVNAPLVYEQQRYRSLQFAGLARRIERAVWRAADLLVAVSEPLRRDLEEAGVAAQRVRVLPNAVDNRLFHLDVPGWPVRTRLRLGGRFVIGFSGTFKRWHGVDWLLAAFEELHRADPLMHLLLVGDGPLRPELEQQVRNASLEHAVTFAGSVIHSAMPEYLAAMDVAVAPYPPLENFYYSPLKLFEYMATGRAVVASAAGQVKDFIGDGVTGLLYEPGDRAGFVGCVRRLRADEDLRRRLGRSASIACRSHTWSGNAGRVLDWVRALGREERRPLPVGGEEHGVL